jgi:hypothetical protein
MEAGDGDDGEGRDAGACPVGDGPVRRIDGDEFGTRREVDSASVHVAPFLFGEAAVGESNLDACGGDQPGTNGRRSRPMSGVIWAGISAVSCSPGSRTETRWYGLTGRGRHRRWRGGPTWRW